MTISLLGYAQLIFRFSDLASLRECDITFYNEHVVLFVKSNSLGTKCAHKFKYLPSCNAGILFHFFFFFFPFYLANIQGGTDKLLFWGLILLNKDIT